MALKFYVASSSDEEGIRQTREVIAALIAVGHECTFDWTIAIDEARRKYGPSLNEVPLSTELENARADFQAVIDADVVIYVAPLPKSEGASFELGVASVRERLGFCKVLVFDPHGRRRFFAKLPLARAISIEGVLSFMQMHANDRRPALTFSERLRRRKVE